MIRIINYPKPLLSVSSPQHYENASFFAALRDLIARDELPAVLNLLRELLNALICTFGHMTSAFKRCTKYP